MTLDLVLLHQHGAEVSGEHGYAWERLPVPVRPEQVAELRQRLGRPVYPADISGRAPTHHAVRGAKPTTPGQVEFHQIGYLSQETLEVWRRLVADHGSEAIARRAGFCRSTAERAVRGEVLTPSTRKRIESVVRAALGRARKFGG